MTNQEAFTKMKNHLLKQGKQALDESGDCKYRAPGGLMCAVGCLIPDDVYSPDMEDWGALRMGASLSVFKDVSNWLLAECQEIHDRTPPSLWADELRIFAEENLLEY